jgi:tetratricopeptide (TPR) repeat protein
MSPSLWRTGLVLTMVLGLAVAARAGPLEAREAWKRAQTLRTGPWGARVRAYREVRGETTPTDSVYARALRAEAGVWRDAHRAHAAAAAEAWAAALGPASDPDRAGALLALAKGLRAEGDDAAAREPLGEAARVGRTAVPWEADEALEVLAEDAADRRDEADLRGVLKRLEDERARPSTRIQAWDRLGLLALARGDVDEARRCLARAERAYRDAERADPREAARATKAWLDAALRRALKSARG